MPRGLCRASRQRIRNRDVAARASDSHASDGTAVRELHEPAHRFPSTHTTTVVPRVRLMPQQTLSSICKRCGSSETRGGRPVERSSCPSGLCGVRESRQQDRVDEPGASSGRGASRSVETRWAGRRLSEQPGFPILNACCGVKSDDCDRDFVVLAHGHERGGGDVAVVASGDGGTCARGGMAVDA